MARVLTPGLQAPHIPKCREHGEGWLPSAFYNTSSAVPSPLSLWTIPPDRKMPVRHHILSFPASVSPPSQVAAGKARPCACAHLPPLLLPDLQLSFPSPTPNASSLCNPLCLPASSLLRAPRAVWHLQRSPLSCPCKRWPGLTAWPPRGGGLTRPPNLHRCLANFHATHRLQPSTPAPTCQPPLNCLGLHCPQQRACPLSGHDQNCPPSPPPPSSSPAMCLILIREDTTLMGRTD